MRERPSAIPTVLPCLPSISRFVKFGLGTHIAYSGWTGKIEKIDTGNRLANANRPIGTYEIGNLPPLRTRRLRNQRAARDGKAK